MKLNKWLFGAAALAMMASCSDNLDGPSSAQPEGGEGYIGINIQLPTVSATRANDNFEDGEFSEYRVRDAVLVLFQGTSEATATCTGSFNLQEADPTYDQENDQITRRSIRVANVKGLEDNNNLYALVLVNGIANNMYTLTKPEMDWMKGKTIQQFQEQIFNETTKLYNQNQKGKNYASNIFMTNSPLSENLGGTENPGEITGALPVLVKLNKTTYPTQSEAIANPAGTIHVERAVAKITCSKINDKTDVVVKVDGVDYKLEVESVAWDMAQDMKDTYVVRNTNRRPKGTTSGNNFMWRWNYTSALLKDISNYRMVGHEPLPSKVDGVQKTYYRPYFCQVPGYNVPKETGNETEEAKNFTKETMEAKDAIAWTGLTGPGAFYPRENTFPVEYMKYANTTRIGLWITFKFVAENGSVLDMKDKNFYINGMDKTTLYTDVNGLNPLENLALARLTNEEEYNRYTALWTAVRASLDTENPGAITLELKDLIDIKSSFGEDGSVVIDAVDFKSLEDLQKVDERFNRVPDFSFENDLDALNNLGQYYAYEAGKVFYEVRIKHFGDDQTPWNGDELSQATDIEEAYGVEPARRQNFLGRYGIVRNNWYDLNVTKIAHLGYPKDPAAWDDTWKDKPDDNKDQYIAVELKVLSWAKRSQDVEF